MMQICTRCFCAVAAAQRRDGTTVRAADHVLPHMLRTTCCHAVCRSAVDVQAAQEEAATAARAEVDRLTNALEAATERAATAERRATEAGAAAQQSSEQLGQYAASWGDLQSQHEQLSAQYQQLQSQNQQLQASLQVLLSTHLPASACHGAPAQKSALQPADFL